MSCLLLSAFGDVGIRGKLSLQITFIISDRRLLFFRTRRFIFLLQITEPPLFTEQPIRYWMTKLSAVGCSNSDFSVCHSPNETYDNNNILPFFNLKGIELPAIWLIRNLSFLAFYANHHNVKYFCASTASIKSQHLMSRVNNNACGCLCPEENAASWYEYCFGIRVGE